MTPNPAVLRSPRRSPSRPTDHSQAYCEDVTSLRTVLYSFIAYRQIRDGVIWVDELYTAACVRQQGVARWLLCQMGNRQRVELQVSKAETEQAEAARHSYTGMGLRPLGRRGRSHVVTEADPGCEIWVTPEYNVTSGWSPVTPRDTRTHDTWGALAEAQRNALIHTVMEAHGYSKDVARQHFSGTDVSEEATIMLITHDLTAPPPPPLTPPPLPHGRSVRRRGEAGLRRQPDGVTRPRHHRATTSRHNTATLHAVERALRGTIDADGDSSGVT